jgi:hypothetical protein
MSALKARAYKLGLVALLLLNLLVWSSVLTPGRSFGSRQAAAASSAAITLGQQTALDGANILLLLTPIYHFDFLPLIER